jgi:hypothetical protein
MAVDETKLNEMIGKVITDIGATFHAPFVLIGEKLDPRIKWCEAKA